MTLSEYLNRIRRIDVRIGSLSESGKDPERLKRFIDFRDSVKADIDSIPDNVLATLIEEKYVRDKTWEQVTAILGYREVSYVRKALRDKAFAELEKIIQKKYHTNTQMYPF